MRAAAKLDFPLNDNPKHADAMKFADVFRLRSLVMGAAVVALVVLVILPIGSLLIGSIWSDKGFTLGEFQEALSGRLYVQALLNSLVLGAGATIARGRLTEQTFLGNIHEYYVTLASGLTLRVQTHPTLRLAIGEMLSALPSTLRNAAFSAA